MSADQTLKIARQLIAAIGTEEPLETIASLFDDEVVVEFPGDVGALPWIGRKVGRAAITQFIGDSRSLIARDEFAVQDFLSSDTRAAVVGTLTVRVLATGRFIRSPFVILLTVSDGAITQFLMLEDSFAVSRAARP